jgi:DNA-binding CsgD family transcriptional regulator
MLLENLTYLATFLTTTGMAVIGSLISHQLARESQHSATQYLFYQQVFMFSFFIHAIWGNLLLRQVISDLDPGNDLIGKLAFFVPLTALPFLITSWFMLIKFGFRINGYSHSGRWSLAYFSIFFLLIIVMAFLVQNNMLILPGDPDLFLIRGFIGINLLFHLLFSWPFLKPYGSHPGFSPNRKFLKCLVTYLTGVAFYSILVWFTNVQHFLSLNLSILVLFGAGSLLPVCLKYLTGIPEKKAADSDHGFQAFCTDFEISKREAEIILEICSGKTNKAIAEKLFITLQTVKDHTHRIYTKTRVKSRVQLANLVRERTTMSF